MVVILQPIENFNGFVFKIWKIFIVHVKSERAFYEIFYCAMKRRAREINLEIIRVANVSWVDINTDYSII